MVLSTDDTIVAIASASGGALRGILRMSGPATRVCLAECFDVNNGVPLEKIKLAEVVAGQFKLPAPFPPIDCDVYFWPNDRSYTRQPTAEIHAIGSPPLLEAMLRTLCVAGARLAEPGEFTLRAFLAGRLDLTQAEAVLGVIDAGSKIELNVALQQLAGGLAAPLHELRSQLLDLLAHLEAGLDFVEEDIEFITAAELDRQISSAATIVEDLVQQMTVRGETRADVRVVLVGYPNVGKSSLLNALAGEQAAIVADQPGTTRDYISRRLMINNTACLLIDTAGVEADAGELTVEGEAQSLTREQHERAHVQIFCLDASRSCNDWERERLARLDTENQIIVFTKADREIVNETSAQVIHTSSVTGLGLDELRLAIAEAVAETASHDSMVVSGTATRCQESLRQAAESLARARDIVRHRAGEELVAAELRVALDELGKVAGAVYTDDVLDRIFSRFCIGK